MSNAIIQQGRFTQNAVAAVPVFLNLRADIDWIEVINMTTLTAAGAATGVKYYWQRGMADDTGIEYTKLNADSSITIGVLAAGGFTRLDTSGNPDGAINANITRIQAANAGTLINVTAGLQENGVVRFVNVPGAQQFGGVDFTIDTIIANTSFQTPFAPNIVNTGVIVGSLYPVRFNPLYYPRRRFITSITVAAAAVVVMTVTHGYTVGQKVRFQVSADYGMREINNLTGTITAIDAATNSITTDIDSTAFTAFAWPLTADVPFTPAQVIPVGEDSTLGITLEDATRNTGEIQMRLAAGTHSPAGAISDVIYWRAGKSFSVDNA